MELKCYPILNGIMAWWSSVEDAARYIEKYCAFTGLAAIDGQTRGAASSISRAASHVHVAVGLPPHSGFDYYIKVQAENRNGEIIAESEKIKSTVREI